MFDFVRNNTRIVLGALLLLIIPSFVFFGVEGYTQFRDGSNASVATVDGRSITRAEWERAHQRAVDRLRRENPEAAANVDSDKARQETLDGLVRERVLEAAARAMHLAPSDDRLRRLFASDPQFTGLRNPDGSVNRELLAMQGMSSEMFAAQLRGDLAAQQVLVGVARTAIATPAIADATRCSAARSRCSGSRRPSSAPRSTRAMPTSRPTTAPARRSSVRPSKRRSST